MINLPYAKGMYDAEVAQLIFKRLEINTKNKSLDGLIDELDSRLKQNQKNSFLKSMERMPI